MWEGVHCRAQKLHHKGPSCSNDLLTQGGESTTAPAKLSLGVVKMFDWNDSGYVLY